MILWTITALAVIKYGLFVLRADDRGQGAHQYIIALPAGKCSHPRTHCLLLHNQTSETTLFQSSMLAKWRFMCVVHFLHKKQAVLSLCTPSCGARDC